MKVTILATLALCVVLSACAAETNTCAWVQPICPSHKDVLTDGTKRQILTHDETLGKSCKK